MAKDEHGGMGEIGDEDLAQWYRDRIKSIEEWCARQAEWSKEQASYCEHQRSETARLKTLLSTLGLAMTVAGDSPDEDAPPQPPDFPG